MTRCCNSPAKHDPETGETICSRCNRTQPTESFLKSLVLTEEEMLLQLIAQWQNEVMITQNYFKGGIKDEIHQKTTEKNRLLR